MSGGLREKERSHQSQGQNILGLRKENQAEHKECTNAHINSLLSSECCAWGEERYRTDCPAMAPDRMDPLAGNGKCFLLCRLKTSKQSRSPINYLEFTLHLGWECPSHASCTGRRGMLTHCLGGNAHPTHRALGRRGMLTHCLGGNAHPTHCALAGVECSLYGLCPQQVWFLSSKSVSQDP